MIDAEGDAWLSTEKTIGAEKDRALTAKEAKAAGVPSSAYDGSTDKPLTHKQQRYVAAWMASAESDEVQRSIQCARIAGYVHKDMSAVAWYLRRNGRISRAIEAEQTRTRASSGSIVSREELIDICAELARSTLQDGKTRIAAIERLSRMLGYDAPKSAKPQAPPMVLQVFGLNPADLPSSLTGNAAVTVLQSAAPEQDTAPDARGQNVLPFGHNNGSKP